MGVVLNPFTGNLDFTGPPAAPKNATFIIQTPNASLANAQSLSALASGFVKNTTTTGVLSVVANIAVGDFASPNISQWTNDANYTTLAIVNAQNLSVFAATTSAQLASVISDGTGSGLLVFGTSPSLTGPITLTEVVGSSALTITGATQTSSFPALSITQTWNASGTTFTGIFANVTNTASAAGSKLLDLQVGGISQISIGKTGNLTGLSNVLDVRNSTSAQTFNIYNTYTDASNYERLAISWNASSIATIGTQNAGTGNARLLRILHSNSLSVAMTVSSLTASIDLAQGSSGSTVVAGKVRIGSAQNVTATTGTHSTLSVVEGAAPTGTSTMVFSSLTLSPTINYSNATPGAGSYEALKIAVTETALPTGNNYLIRAMSGSAGASERFLLRNDGYAAFAGNISIGTVASFPSASVSINAVGNIVFANGFATLSASGTSTAFTITQTSGNTEGILLTPGSSANKVEQYNSTNPQTFNIYNTRSDATTYERLAISWASNVCTIGMQKGSVGGSLRNVKFGTPTQPYMIQLQTSDVLSLGIGAISSFAQTWVTIGSNVENNPTSGTDKHLVINPNWHPTSTSTLVGIPLQISPTINFSAGTPGAGSYEALKIAVTETALPTGTNYLIRASAGSAGTTDKFTVKNNGDVLTVGKITTIGGATFHTTSSALTDGAGAGAGTITNAPAAGNPTKWIGIDDNGTTRYIPAW